MLFIIIVDILSLPIDWSPTSLNTNNCHLCVCLQDHYDWGLRAIKSVLVVAGSLKRSDPGRPEDQVTAVASPLHCTLATSAVFCHLEPCLLVIVSCLEMLWRSTRRRKLIKYV